MGKLNILLVITLTFNYRNNQSQGGLPLHIACIIGQNQRVINENPSIQIKKEIDEDELEMKPEVHVSMPCPICGMGETGTHNHYGGRACTSCRAFFRRSVQTNSYKVPHNCNYICNITLYVI